MVGSSSGNAALWEGIKDNYSNKLSKLEQAENRLRYRVAALERFVDNGPNPCLCDNKKTRSAPQADLELPPVDISYIPKDLNECPCKPCPHKKKFNTDTCGCTDKGSEQCGCTEKAPEEEPKCDCNEKKLQALLQEIEKSAPDVLARDVQIPSSDLTKKDIADCNCDVTQALKSRILPIIDEMLDDFCCACDSVKNVFSPLQSKHKCSCLNMLELPPPSCTCLTKNGRKDSTGRRSSEGSAQKHPEGCECSACECDPCGGGKGSSKISQNRDPNCECGTCECDPCCVGSGTKTGEGTSGQHENGNPGSTCDCLECVCDPCGILAKSNNKISSPTKKGCQCGDSTRASASERMPTRPSTNKRKSTDSRNGCPCTNGSTAGRSPVGSKASTGHGPDCACLRCICDPCSFDTRPNSRASKSDRAGSKDGDGKLPKAMPKPSRENRRGSGSQGKCGCDDVAAQPSKSPHKQGSSCDCDACSCESCGIKEPPANQPHRPGPNCECESCVCDPCGPSGTDTESCACTECLCDSCKRQIGKKTPAKDMVDCGCDPCLLDAESKPKRRSAGGCGPPPISKMGSKIPVAQGCVCKDPCPCDPCYFDNEAMEALTKSVINGKNSCECPGGNKTIKTKLTKARNQISSMSIRSTDVGHMKEIIQMYNTQKTLKKRIQELESKQKHLANNRCR